ncbi:hypothetical protein OH76DRAFT_849678 [Lentinus brumalis]|uniref:Uncharacterized protein n=1 Tax=Lentinus brumalis TaxID=2498619 RepID=A0A371DQV4_9APHY|nr:hypothetical protein OH76DRAFT_849678 [Polyporus brumalis]
MRALGDGRACVGTGLSQPFVYYWQISAIAAGTCLIDGHGRARRSGFSPSLNFRYIRLTVTITITIRIVFDIRITPLPTTHVLTLHSTLNTERVTRKGRVIPRSCTCTRLHIPTTNHHGYRTRNAIAYIYIIVSSFLQLQACTSSLGIPCPGCLF